VKPAIRKLAEDEFRRGASISLVSFPRDSTEIPDTPRLTLVLADPESEWSGSGALRTQIADWTKNRGKAPRIYPGALVWCIKKPGRELREKTEVALAWKRVAREIADGTLGGDFDRSDRADLQAKVKDWCNTFIEDQGPLSFEVGAACYTAKDRRCNGVTT
jgi:hypothetical protein